MKKKLLLGTAAVFFTLFLSPSLYADNAPTSASEKNTAISSSSSPSDTPVSSVNTTNKDPLVRFNRAMFSFNDALDKIIIKPIATLYNKIIPRPLNLGINNFFNNLGELPTIANDILQLHFYQMANDMWRFGINSTLGIGGLFDVASRMDLKYYKNDFGLTLAYWGYQPSTYLVLPFLGPNTFRDAIGIPVDYFEFSVYPYIQPQSLRYQIFGLWIIDRRAQLLKYQSVMEEAALDKYVFFRNAYMQSRAYEIEQNKHLDFKDRMAEDNSTS